jgi:hypothetical protein
MKRPLGTWGLSCCIPVATTSPFRAIEDARRFPVGKSTEPTSQQMRSLSATRIG